MDNIQVSFNNNTLGFSVIQQSNNNNNNNNNGFGLYVGSLIVNSFAYKNGIQIGDKIIKVNNHIYTNSPTIENFLYDIENAKRPVIITFEKTSSNNNNTNNAETVTKLPRASRKVDTELQGIYNAQFMKNRETTSIMSMFLHLKTSSNKVESKCAYILEEIYLSEETYVQDLHYLIDEFVTPLSTTFYPLKCKSLSPQTNVVLCEHNYYRKNCPEDSNIKAPMMNGDELNKVFLNISNLLKINQNMVNALKTGFMELIRGQHDKPNNNNHHHHPTLSAVANVVSTVFIKVAPFMKLYSVYCHDFGVARDFLLHLRRERPALNEFLAKDRIGNNSKSLPIEYLMIKPIQRVCKYPLLFDELIHCFSGVTTTTSNKDLEEPLWIVNLKKASQAVFDVTETVNKSVEKLEAMQHMIYIFEQLGGNDVVPNLVQPSRRFIRRLPVNLCIGGGGGVDGKEKKPRHLFLFNDCIIFAKEERVGGSFRRRPGSFLLIKKSSSSATSPSSSEITTTLGISSPRNSNIGMNNNGVTSTYQQESSPNGIRASECLDLRRCEIISLPTKTESCIVSLRYHSMQSKNGTKNTKLINKLDSANEQLYDIIVSNMIDTQELYHEIKQHIEKLRELAMQHQKPPSDVEPFLNHHHPPAVPPRKLNHSNESNSLIISPVADLRKKSLENYNKTGTAKKGPGKSSSGSDLSTLNLIKGLESDLDFLSSSILQFNEEEKKKKAIGDKGIFTMKMPGREEDHVGEEDDNYLEFSFSDIPQPPSSPPPPSPPSPPKSATTETQEEEEEEDIGAKTLEANVHTRYDHIHVNKNEKDLFGNVYFDEMFKEINPLVSKDMTSISPHQLATSLENSFISPASLSRGAHFMSNSSDDIIFVGAAPRTGVVSVARLIDSILLASENDHAVKKTTTTLQERVPWIESRNWHGDSMKNRKRNLHLSYLSHDSLQANFTRKSDNLGKFIVVFRDTIDVRLSYYRLIRKLAKTVSPDFDTLYAIDDFHMVAPAPFVTIHASKGHHQPAEAAEVSPLERNMVHWLRASISHPDSILIVFYEELLHDPKKLAEKILKFCHLPIMKEEIILKGVKAIAINDLRFPMIHLSDSAIKYFGRTFGNTYELDKLRRRGCTDVSRMKFSLICLHAIKLQFHRSITHHYHYLTSYELLYSRITHEGFPFQFRNSFYDIHELPIQGTNGTSSSTAITTTTHHHHNNNNNPTKTRARRRSSLGSIAATIALEIASIAVGAPVRQHKFEESEELIRLRANNAEFVENYIAKTFPNSFAARKTMIRHHEQTNIESRLSISGTTSPRARGGSFFNWFSAPPSASSSPSPSQESNSQSTTPISNKNTLLQVDQDKIDFHRDSDNFQILRLSRTKHL